MATSQASIAADFKTILFATDFSSSSEAALPYVLGLAHRFDSKVIAVHAVPFEPLAGLAAVPPMVEIDLEWRDALRDMRTYEASNPFAGSFAEEIFRSVTCPILIVGPGVDPKPAENWAPRRILFATEFDEGS